MRASSWRATKAFSPRRRAPPAWPRCEKLLATGFLKPAERIVIYNTGAGLEVSGSLSPRVFRAPPSGEQDKLGGLITPR